MTQFTLKETDQKIGIVELCSGIRDDGNPCHSYVLIEPSKYQAFIRSRDCGEPVNLTQYGKVIHFGLGMLPPDHIKRRMEEQYNVNHHFVKDIAKVMTSIREELNYVGQ